MGDNKIKVGLVVNWTKPIARHFVPELIRWMEKTGFEVIFTEKSRKGAISWRAVKEADLVVALGGDGTLLRAVQIVGEAETPIMGVNLGGLGFLTEFSVREARRGITDFARGKFCEEKRMVVECRLTDQAGRIKKMGYALNDCAVNMGPSGRVVEVALSWNEKFLNKFVGDGVVVATPTGSTAYSLAAGGPVLYPTMTAFVITPLCPHALAARPIVMPGDGTVELKLTGKSQVAVVTIDGQRRWQLNLEERMIVGRASFSVRLVVPRKKSCFEILRNKLKWSGSQR
ncbi:MAG: NAD(+)/NADH kinase [bacterium]